MHYEKVSQANMKCSYLTYQVSFETVLESPGLSKLHAHGNENWFQRSEIFFKYTLWILKN